MRMIVRAGTAGMTDVRGVVRDRGQDRLGGLVTAVHVATDHAPLRQGANLPVLSLAKIAIAKIRIKGRDRKRRRAGKRKGAVGRTGRGTTIAKGERRGERKTKMTGGRRR